MSTPLSYKNQQLAAYCGACGFAYPNANRLALQSPDMREPCPSCGFEGISFHLPINESVKTHSMMMLKAIHEGFKKPFVELKVGDDLYRKTGQWMKLERLIHRESDRYLEKVTDPRTGRIAHFCDEPLSEHQGHGSPKRKA